MKMLNFIIDKPLPITQDFNLLKNEGLAHIQKITGNEWTNLNPSDPGITILDQLCYALTELGYCNNFPIEDILTDADNKLILKDQFYLPEEILTTSPVTIADYIKYIIDEFDEVENAVIVPQQSVFAYIKGIYTIYLSLDPDITKAQDITKICRSVFYRLNKRRNIGEIFMMPSPLQIMAYTLKGQLQIIDVTESDKIITLIQNKIRHYIFPKVVQEDDSQLIVDGETTDNVYNGPELRHGWVDDDNLGTKINVVYVRDLINIIQSVVGVKTITGLQIENAKYNDFVTSKESQLLSFDLSQLEIICLSSPKPMAAVTSGNSGYKHLKSDTSFGVAVNKQQNLPKGKYRDINSYYSIQNTFPEIYAVGANAINSNATDFQIAQSRQLKGYLTLFDQVLANQFSQLTNVHQLFSFKNGQCGTPSDMENFYATKSPYQKEHLEYPVPFLTFSPTYFYQSLYNVPNIRPLLKNNNAFGFSLETRPQNVAEAISWEQFKQDPYNAYIKGLQDMVENETINLARRNEMLDHLLARHGESPLLMDAIIDGTLYSGNSQKDSVIVKSLYLQNLALLSYYRYKAYNYLGAKKIAEIGIALPSDLGKLLSEINTIHFYLEKDKSIKSTEDKYDDFENDFIFNSNKVDHVEKIKLQDFINYSTLELQLNILLGLRMPYINYVQDLVDGQGDKECPSCASHPDADKCPDCTLQINQCLWLLKERKGLICIENNLLYPCDNTIIITTALVNGTCYGIIEPISYPEAMALYVLLESATSIDIGKKENPKTPFDGKLFDEKPSHETVLTINGSLTYSVMEITPTDSDIYWTTSTMAEIDYFFAMHQKKVSEATSDVKTLQLFFPNYIPYFNTEAFANRLELFLTNALPVEVSYDCQFVSPEKLNLLIPAYTTWYNSLVFKNEKYEKQEDLATALVSIINAPDTVKQ